MLVFVRVFALSTRVKIISVGFKAGEISRKSISCDILVMPDQNHAAFKRIILTWATGGRLSFAAAFRQNAGCHQKKQSVCHSLSRVLIKQSVNCNVTPHSLSNLLSHRTQGTSNILLNCFSQRLFSACTTYLTSVNTFQPEIYQGRPAKHCEKKHCLENFARKIILFEVTDSHTASLLRV